MPLDLLQGTLDLLVLRALEGEARHGYSIQRRLEEMSNGGFQVEEGSLYPALYRMEKRGWVTSTWGRSENNRKARFYRTTAAGRRQLAVETKAWSAFSGTVDQVLGR